MLFLAGIAGPVQFHMGQLGKGLVASGSAGIKKPCQLIRRFFFYPQQHQESAKLNIFHVSVEDGLHGLTGFLTGEAAAGTFAAAQCADERRKSMFSHDSISSGLRRVA